MNKRDPELPRGLSSPAAPSSRAACEFDRVALVLQGGGALGAYQAGVYQRLLEGDIEPHWIAGISIGAINSAIIAGNAREHRLDRLREFWELVSSSYVGGPGTYLSGLPLVDPVHAWVNQLAAGRAFAQGVNGFFQPRMPPPYLLWGGGGATSYYDSSPLRATLERLVDFDRINAKEMRLSVGAVNVRTGNFAYFDNATDHIRPEHIMASGALPPGFDAVEIDGEKYWDGGMVSNTPLEWVLSNGSGRNTLVWQVDLWSAHGELPRDLASVATRIKEIQYSSRTRSATDSLRKVKKLRTALSELLAMIPEDVAASPQAKLLAAAADPALYNIIELVYRSATYEGQYKDVEFSRRTMNEHWQAGYADAEVTLQHQQILKLPPIDNNPAVFDFLTKPAQPK